MKETLNHNNTLTITCKVCSKPFSLTTEEQNWYRSKGYSFPKTCYNCRRLKRAKQNTNGHEGVLNITNDFRGF